MKLKKNMNGTEQEEISDSSLCGNGFLNTDESKLYNHRKLKAFGLG
jgi:hypothetical protein